MSGFGARPAAWSTIVVAGLGIGCVAAAPAGIASQPAEASVHHPIGLAERAGEHDVEGVHVFAPSLAWLVGNHGPGAYHGVVRQWDGASWSRMGGLQHLHADFHGMDALAPDDAWLVGFYAPKPGAATVPLAAHWDGSRWRATQTGDLPRSGFNAVTELNPDDVWAVGLQPVAGGDATLAEHWDGARWTAYPTPNLAGSDLNDLVSVVALTPNDVWALGETFTSVTEAYTEHWNGRKWSLVSLPDPLDQFYEIDASGADDVWAVGRSTAGPQAVHWDGSQWTVVPALNPPGRYGDFYAMTVIGPNDVWAVGAAYDQAPIQSLVEHWDGSKWSIVPSPSPGLYLNDIRAVGGGDGPDDLWAVGDTSDESDSYDVKLLYLHWDGKQWTHVRSEP